MFVLGWCALPFLLVHTSLDHQYPCEGYDSPMNNIEVPFVKDSPLCLPLEYHGDARFWHDLQ
jgi:hypothetical protein